MTLCTAPRQVMGWPIHSVASPMLSRQDASPAADFDGSRLPLRGDAHILGHVQPFNIACFQAPRTGTDCSCQEAKRGRPACGRRRQLLTFRVIILAFCVWVQISLLVLKVRWVPIALIIFR